MATRAHPTKTRFPAIPEQSAVMRTIGSAMHLHNLGFITRDEWMTIRARICAWDSDFDADMHDGDVRSGAGRSK